MESSKVCAKFGGAATALTALGRRKRANLRIIASLPVALACHGASFGCRSAVESCRQSPLQIVRAFSSEGSNGSVPIRTVPIQVAHELLNAGHRYLDVRTAEEFASGHIEGAVNVPYMLKAGIGLTKNLKFLEEVSEKFGKDDEVVVVSSL
ncbi:hypothetical protein KP509_04G067500 [Ceratopteris richardii]|uniref:Rhodanese domain-containing protein n=1 Tax=Ceratopteris richardii TaxID=49495 RepID=A0A8T2UWD6_CERRI|nr:hypothetical protein KP509_04G067500 [Ceratopteris richardii]